jgi:hypothetical protein
MTEADQSKTYFHKVSRGDFGVPMLTGPAIWMVANFSYVAFYPLGIGETVFWCFYPRQYNFDA